MVLGDGGVCHPNTRIRWIHIGNSKHAILTSQIPFPGIVPFQFAGRGAGIEIDFLLDCYTMAANPYLWIVTWRPFVRSVLASHEYVIILWVSVGTRLSLVN